MQHPLSDFLLEIVVLANLPIEGSVPIQQKYFHLIVILLLD